MVACRAVRRPPAFSGLGTVSILTIDLDKGLWEVDADAVMTDAQTVYGSTGHLYVATQRWIDPHDRRERPADDADAHPPLRRERPRPHDLRGERRGPGLPAQPVLALRAGRRPARRLDRRPGVVAGPPAGLVAEPGDRPAPRRGDPRRRRARRRASARASASTRCASSATSATSSPSARSTRSTRSTSPTRARRRSSASSSCWATRPTCTRSPTTCCSASARTRRPRAGPRASRSRSSASATRPTRSCSPSTRSATASSSQVEFDSHAFLYWAPRQLVVLPVQVYDDDPGASSPGFSGAVALTVAASGIAEAGRIAHDPTDGYVPTISRSIVIGDQLLTVSDGGVMASALDGFARVGLGRLPAAAGG